MEMTDGAPVTYAAAIQAALREEMQRDPQVMLLGEEADDRATGAMALLGDLAAEFGPERVLALPTAPSAMMGAAVGAALAGLRPVVTLSVADLLAGAFTAITEAAAKLHWRTAGARRVPLVIRCAAGAGSVANPWRAQLPETWFMGVPGLKIVLPATPFDAKGLLKTAIRDDNPVLFLEHHYLYRRLREPLPEAEYTLPIGQAEVRRAGDHLTLIAYGATLYHALDAADVLANEGISAEVLDLRTLAPLDLATIAASVQHTHRALIAHEASQTGGVGAEIAAQLAAVCFSELRAPVMRVAAPDVPHPASPALAAAYQPDASRIAQAARVLVAT
jgi:2-oxoisovalerate dehydrogenase E1 component beta subunit